MALHLDLKHLAFPILAALYVLFTPAGEGLLYNPLVTGEHYSIWPILFGVGRALCCVAFSGLVLLTGSRNAVLQGLGPLWPIFLFVLISVSWSIDPKISWRYAAYVISIGLCMSAVVRWRGALYVWRASAIVTGCIAIASMGAALLPPHLGIHHATDLFEPVHAGSWRGIFVHKNALGEISMTSLILLTIPVAGEKKLWAAFFWLARLSALTCLIMSRSSSAYVSAAVVVVLFLALRFRPTSRPLPLLLTATFAGLLAYGFSLTPEQMAGMVGKPTFSGRTEIWAYAARLISERLWLGHGFGTGQLAFGATAVQKLFSSATDMHNAYLDMMFNLGAIGTAIFLLTVLYIWVRAYASTFALDGRDRLCVITYLCIVAGACVTAFTEIAPFQTVGDGAVGLWFSLIVLAQVPPPRAQRRRFVFTPPLKAGLTVRGAAAGEPT